jgi:MtN3 and saliva related transmembrane protein
VLRLLGDVGTAAVLTLLGTTAGVLTTVAWAPQILRSWRTRSTGDLSWAYLLTLAVGGTLWVLYGCLSGDLVVVLANAVMLLALSVLAAFKLVFVDPVSASTGSDAAA